jgi:hypothetical protein
MYVYVRSTGSMTLVRVVVFPASRPPSEISPLKEGREKMIRKFSLAALMAIGSFSASQQAVMADHNCYRSSHYHGYSGYRPPISNYNSAYGSYGPGVYGSYFGQPVPNTFSHGYSSYFGSNYGTGYHAPFGGYGVSGFPRYNTGAFGPGITLYFGR